jgi:NAD-dependent deacetylase
MLSKPKFLEKVTTATVLFKKAKSLLVITGAGISAESGMPTYRGPNGLYEQNPDVESILSVEGLENEPHKLWQHIDSLRACAAKAQPNQAHQILAQWEQENRFEKFLIATQNIDGLHQKAGSERVTELHGSLWQMARPRTVDYTEDDQFSDDAQAWMSSRNRESILRRWSEENNQTVWENREVPFAAIPPCRDPEVRPNVLFFNENYGTRLMWVEDFIRQAPDVVLVIGCSGSVSILDRLLRNCLDANPDCSIININPHEDCIQQSHLYIQQSAADALSALNSQLELP